MRYAVFMGEIGVRSNRSQYGSIDMSVKVIEKRPFRVEDLDRADIPEKFVEIVEGELIEMTPAGKFHNRVAYNIQRLFDSFRSERPELDFGGDNEGFLVSRDPDTLLSPDACLFRKRPELEKTWLEFAPEIAVEVLSPSNSQSEIFYKRRLYFETGSEQFWQVDPEKKEIEFFHKDGRVVTVAGDETIEGEGIAAGMRISLAEVFKL